MAHRRIVLAAGTLIALALLAVAIAWLLRPWLLAAIGGGATVCRVPESERQIIAALAAEREREADLRRDLASLGDRLSTARAQCKAPPAPPPRKVEAVPPPAPPPEPKPKRVAEAPRPPPPPKQEEAPPSPPEDEPPPEAPPDAPRDLPRERWDARDITMLEGCWTRLSNMSIQDIRTRQIRGVQHWRMCFDRGGQGSQEIALDNGVNCRGRLAASFQGDGRLALDDTEDIRCSDGSKVFRREGACEPTSDHEAECVTRQPAVGSPPLRTRFHR